MKRALRVLASLLAAAHVAACSAGVAERTRVETNWQRQGTPIEAMQADLSDCQSQALDVVRDQMSIDADIASARGGGSAASQRGVPLPGATDSSKFSLEKRRANIINNCMRAKGYLAVR